ncbi:MAG: hypothetical protein AAFO69_11760 [Bacteroidota bacterium]
MKKLSVIILLILVAGYSFGQSSYYPMEKGKSYTYAYGKELYESMNVDVSKLKMTVSFLNETKAINGKEYIVSQTSSGGMTPDFTSYARVKSDGTIVGFEEGETEEFTFLTKSPKVGDSWSRTKDGAKSTSKVVDLSGAVKTPTKSYADCLVLESTENGATTRAYFKRGVGMVAVTVLMAGEEKLFIYLLEQ